MLLRLLLVTLLSLNYHTHFSPVVFSVVASAEVEVRQQEGSCAAGEDGEGGSCSATGVNNDSSDTASNGSNASTDTTKVTADENDSNNSASKCQDQHDKCEMWASLGECNANPPYMHVYCKRSCELCDEQMYVW